HMHSPQVTMRVLLPGEEAPCQIRLRIQHAVVEDDTVILGAAFDPANQEERERVIRLCYGTSEHWIAFQARRHGRRTILGGFLFLLSLSAVHGVASLLKALRERALITEGWTLPGRGRAKRIALDFGGGDD
ncbi:MAG: hypothetical protein R3349_10035, partial [Geminicoccaceae bacterium]|nr:hypothetical protein [Geminicoccaceae bacterium]